jgi:predicted amidohydrolase YtcJ
VPLAFGSDVPIEPIAPLSGIGAAVHRARPEDRRGPWYPQERLTPWEAIWGFTAGAALAAGDGWLRGMIRPGLLADLVVLDRNILTVTPKKIFDTQVSMTFVDGDCVFDASR